MKLLSLFIILLLTYVPQIAANSAEKISQIQHDIKILDDEYKIFSSDFFQSQVNYSSVDQKILNDIEQLEIKIQGFIDKKQPIEAIQLLFTNLDTVKDNLDHRASFLFLKLLLDNNEWNIANTLFRAIKQEADKSLLATVQFLFAKYHAERHEWIQVNNLLNKNITELSSDNADYARLLKGVSLQQQKLHRKALTYYSSISKDSEYYIYSQLNTAIANIRQGWWTDAKRTIDMLLEEAEDDNTDEQLNRTYLILGYSLLQREYFREARIAFGHVDLNSRYANRALLGIGLTATDQTDYTASLNAISILKKRNNLDLSIDESYLIVPFVYEKLGKDSAVINAYNKAMEYYKKRIHILKNLLSQPFSFNNIEYRQITSEISIRENNFNYGEHFPESFINNYTQILKLNKKSGSKSHINKTHALKEKYEKELNLIISFLISQRIEYLESYLNQCEYGLTRFYDISRKRTE